MPADSSPSEAETPRGQLKPVAYSDQGKVIVPMRKPNMMLSYVLILSPESYLLDI